jgi:hypothetical protein
MPFKPGRPVHPTGGTGTAPSSATTPEGTPISFDGGPNRNRQTTGQVIVTNRDAAVNLEISFANGKDGTFFAIAPATTIPFDVMVHNCRLRGDGADVDYSIMGIIV